MRRFVLFVIAIFKYALYAIAGLVSLYVIFVVGTIAYLLIGEAMIPGFRLADHMSKDQSCMGSPPPKGCPGNLAGKTN
jgi:hypothetical protein